MASSSRIMSTVEGSRWARADLKIVHENLASDSDKYTEVALNVRCTQNHNATFYFVTLPLRIQKQPFQPARPWIVTSRWSRIQSHKNVRIRSAKSADNSAIRAEFAVAESCMILKLCMIGVHSTVPYKVQTTVL